MATSRVERYKGYYHWSVITHVENDDFWTVAYHRSKKRDSDLFGTEYAFQFFHTEKGALESVEAWLTLGENRKTEK